MQQTVSIPNQWLAVTSIFAIVGGGCMLLHSLYSYATAKNSTSLSTLSKAGASYFLSGALITGGIWGATYIKYNTP